MSLSTALRRARVLRAQSASSRVPSFPFRSSARARSIILSSPRWRAPAQRGMQMPTLDEPARVRANDKQVSDFLEASRSGALSWLSSQSLSLLASTDTAGWSALHYGASRNHVNALAWLLERAEAHLVDARTTTGCTPLAVACHYGHDSCVAALLAKRAQPLATEKNGLTPLHHAAASGSAATVCTLLRAGASILRAQALKTARGVEASPRVIAARAAATATGAERQRGFAEVLRLLETESKRLHRWFRAAQRFDLATLKLMLTRPDDGVTALADAEDAGGETALQWYERSAPQAAPTLRRLLLEVPVHDDALPPAAAHSSAMVDLTRPTVAEPPAREGAFERRSSISGAMYGRRASLLGGTPADGISPQQQQQQQAHRRILDAGAAASMAPDVQAPDELPQEGGFRRAVRHGAQERVSDDADPGNAELLQRLSRRRASMQEEQRISHTRRMSIMSHYVPTRPLEPEAREAEHEGMGSRPVGDADAETTGNSGAEILQRLRRRRASIQEEQKVADTRRMSILSQYVPARLPVPEAHEEEDEGRPVGDASAVESTGNSDAELPILQRLRQRRASVQEEQKLADTRRMSVLSRYM